MSRILLGFGDICNAIDDVSVGANKPIVPPKPGAAPAKPGATTPGKSGGMKKQLKKGTIAVKVAKAVTGLNSPHKKAMLNAISAGDRALQAGKKGITMTQGYNPAKHAPAVKVAAVVTKKGKVMLGIVPVPGKKPLTAKQVAAVKKHTDAIAKGKAANKALNLAAAKSKKAGNEIKAFAAKTTTFLTKALSGKGQPKTRIGGDPSIGMDEIGLEEGLEAIGLIDELLGEGEEVGADAAGLTSGQPGYDPATEDGIVPGAAPLVDPYATAGATGPATVDPTTGVVSDSNGNTLYDPATDPMLTKMPVRDQPLSDAEMQVAHEHMPDDAIPLPAGAALPDGAVGSYQWFKGGTRMEDGIQKSLGKSSGFIYTRRGIEMGRNQSNPRWMAQVDDTEVVDVDDDGQPKVMTLWERIVPFILPGGIIYVISQMAAGGGDSTLAKISAHSMGANWGPLVGNPDPAVNGGQYVGLQCAYADGKWFWQGPNAPTAVAKDADAKIKAANDLIIKTNTAAAITEAARVAKIAADAAEAKAKQDADNALKESAAASVATIAQTQQDTQKAQADIDYQKTQDTLEAQKTQVDIQAQQAQQTQQSAYAATDVQMQQASIPIAAASDQLAVDQQRQQLTYQAAQQNELISQTHDYNSWASAHPDQAYAAAAQVAQEDQYAESGDQYYDPGDQYVPPQGTDQYVPQGDDFSDGGQSMGPAPGGDESQFDGEAPLMFEEKLLPTDGEEPAAAWPFADDQANMLGDIDRMLGQDVE